MYIHCNYSAIIIAPADCADSADISYMQIKEVANHGNAADMRYAYFVADCADCIYVSILICVILREAATPHLRHCL